MAGHRHDPRRAACGSAQSIATTTPSGSSRSTTSRHQESPVCISGQILQGLKKPHDCPAFGSECTPQTPLGATMVSSEGACAAYYAYGRHLEPAGDRVRKPTFDATSRPSDVVLAFVANGAGRSAPCSPAPARCRNRTTSTSCSGHGSGGQLTADLIQRLFVPAFGNDVLARLEDQATVRHRGARTACKAPRLAFTTDSFVVRPLFFPGGDIGRLAVHGTVNDLAVGGAEPLFLSAAFILEEGLAARRPAADRRLDAARLRRGRGRRWSPATPRSSTAARATRSSSPPRASASFPRAGRSRSARPGPATASSSRERSATTASPSCRCARASSSRPCWKATPRRLTDLARAMLAACPGIRVHARPDPRRAVERAERTGRRPRGSASSSTRRRSRSAPRCGPPARCSASTRSTSPTRAS